MILIAIGANLPNPIHGSPLSTCQAVLPELDKAGLRVIAVSRWYESAPVPVSSQPWYINGVVAVETTLEAHQILQRLLAIEAEFGRIRGQPNAARTLDLDLVAYNDLVLEDDRGPFPLNLPHPRMHERSFVLRPISDIAPTWRHPKTEQTVLQMLAKLDDPDAAQPTLV